MQQKTNIKKCKAEDTPKTARRELTKQNTERASAKGPKEEAPVKEITEKPHKGEHRKPAGDREHIDSPLGSLQRKILRKQITEDNSAKKSKEQNPPRKKPEKMSSQKTEKEHGKNPAIERKRIASAR